jgi:phage I-like protein
MKANVKTVLLDALRDRTRAAEKLADLTKENAKITFEARTGFEKLIATVGERDTQIRALTLQATIMNSEAEANMARFIEVENSRDVHAHLADLNQKKAEETEKKLEGLEFSFSDVRDERDTLMAALRRIVREEET